VWGYALAWFLLNDRIKLLTYWVLDRSKSHAKTNVQSNLAPKDQADPAPRVEAKSAEQPRATTASKEKILLAPDIKGAAGVQPAKAEPSPGTSARKPAEANPSPATGRQTDTDSAAKEAKTAAGDPAKTPIDMTFRHEAAHPLMHNQLSKV